MDYREKHIRALERLYIIRQIIGTIEGVGETYSDEKTYNNLEFVEDLVYTLICSLCHNAGYDGQEGSCVEIKEKSIEILRSCYELMSGVLSDIERRD